MVSVVPYGPSFQSLITMSLSTMCYITMLTINMQLSNSYPVLPLYATIS